MYKHYECNFHSRTVHLDIIKIVYLPTDAKDNCFKKNIKIYIKTAPTCFGAITIITERIVRACYSYSCSSNQLKYIVEDNSVV